MKENTNKAIFYNSLILYSKLIFVTICGLLTTRFALKALGVIDFGLFALLGSIISFVVLLNTIMISTTNRFISISIGNGDKKDINEQFNVCLLVHFSIAIATAIIVLPLGDYYIYHFLNYEGSIDNAVAVFHYTVIGSIISFVGVPFTGLLMAKEKFIVFSFVDLLNHVLKLIVAYLLISHFTHKLFIYAATQGLITALPTLVYFVYCKKKYPQILSFYIPRNKRKYKDVFSFSGWVAYGALAYIGKNQGAAVLVNMFFSTVMNTALGLANTVGTLLTTFSNSVSQPISPQITKNYAAGNMKRCDDLLVMSTKYTYLVMLVISVPFLSDSDFLFKMWLGRIPPYVSFFSSLLIVDALITSLNSGISILIFASGKIKYYQILINSLRLCSILGAYVVLKAGAPAYSLLWAYIFFSVIIFFAGQCVLKATLNYNSSLLWKRSYLPSILVTIVIIPFLLFRLIDNSILNILILESILCVDIAVIGLSKNEKKKIFGKIYK